MAEVSKEQVSSELRRGTCLVGTLKRPTFWVWTERGDSVKKIEKQWT